MKSLPLQSTHYHYLLTAYTQWLHLLGYPKKTTESFPNHVREYLHYLESHRGIIHITHTQPIHFKEFIQYLSQRPNQTRQGGLSIAHINKVIVSINNFGKYLNHADKLIVAGTHKRLREQEKSPTVLTLQEIEKLYQATYIPSRQNSKAYGQRDRAILSVFYGCGLRLSEGVALNLEDIELQNRQVLVKKGKGNKQRYVPLAEGSIQYITDYIEYGRNWFLHQHRILSHYTFAQKKHPVSTSAFFINTRGKRMQSFYDRFRYLKTKSEITTAYSTHTLRHSIATHLLQNGMDLEEISRFLGHSSLESTGLYTHILEQTPRSL